MATPKPRPRAYLTTAHETTVYGRSSEPTPATVRAAFLDRLPANIGTDPPDLERPAVRFEVPGEDIDLRL